MSARMRGGGERRIRQARLSITTDGSRLTLSHVERTTMLDDTIVEFGLDESWLEY